MNIYIEKIGLFIEGGTTKMKRLKRILSFVMCITIALSCLVFSPVVNAAVQVAHEDSEGIYGAHLNYRSTLTAEDDGSYTMTVDIYASYAIHPANRDILSSRDEHYVVEREGWYLVELWGGDGATANGKGGLGGYVYGAVYLKVGQTLYYTLGSGGQLSHTSGEGGGANAGGGYGNQGSTTVGGGGGYSALLLFDSDEFADKYLDDHGHFTGSISEEDRVSKYVMIAGGGGGGGSYSSDNNGTPDGGAGGYVGSVSGVLDSSYDVAGTFYSGENGKSTGTSTAYVGKGGSNVPGKVVTTVWGMGSTDSPNDWKGTYNKNLEGGAGGSGNYRGGGGGAGFCGGSGGVMSNIILANNVGGGGGGSSFISNDFDMDIESHCNQEHEHNIIGRDNGLAGGQVHIVYLDEVDDSYLEHMDISFARTPYFVVNDITAVNTVSSDGSTEEIVYRVRAEGDQKEITYENVEYSETDDAHALQFNITDVSLMPAQDGYERDHLTITVNMSPKPDFAGGNNVPLLVNDAIICTPKDTSKPEYVTGHLSLKNETGYVNVPLNIDVSPVNHTPQGLNPEDTVHDITSLYIDKYASVRDAINNGSDSVPWQYKFIDYIGTHSVEDENGNLLSGSVSPDETTRYFVDLTAVPKTPSSKVFATIGDVVTEKTFRGVSVITVQGSGMDILNGNVVVYNKQLSYDEQNKNYVLDLTISSDSSGSIADYEKLPEFESVQYGGGGNSFSIVTIPVTGTYAITLKGGDGGAGGAGWLLTSAGAGGRGGSISAKFILEAGTHLKFVTGHNSENATSTSQGGQGGGASYVAVLSDIKTDTVDFYLMIASGGGGGGGANIILSTGKSGNTPSGISHSFSGDINYYNGGAGGNSGGNGGSAVPNYVYNGNENGIQYLESSTISASDNKGGAGTLVCEGLGLGGGSVERLKEYTIETAISKYFTIDEVKLEGIFGGVAPENLNYTLDESNPEYVKVKAVVSDIVPAEIQNEVQFEATDDIYGVEFTLRLVLSVKEGFLGGNDVLLLYLDDPSLPTGMRIHQADEGEAPGDFINADESRASDYANVAIPDNIISEIEIITQNTTYHMGSEPVKAYELVESVDGLDELNAMLDAAEWKADYIEIVDPRLDNTEYTPASTTTYTIKAGVKPKKTGESVYANVVDAVDELVVNADATIFVNAQVTFDLGDGISAYVQEGESFVEKSSDTITFADGGYAAANYVVHLHLVNMGDDHHHHLPDKITVTVGGKTLVSGDDYIYEREDDNHSIVTIYKEKITGDVVISAAACHESHKIYYFYQVAPSSADYESIVIDRHFGESIDLAQDFESKGASVPQSEEHYDFVWDWGDGKTEPLTTMPKSDVYVIGRYVPWEYTVTIKYVYEDGTEASAPYTQKIAYGNSFTITSPEIAEFAPDLASVSGQVQGDVEYTVTYRSTAGMLTIFYIYENSGEAAADTYTAELESGAPYSISSPAIKGYTADTKVVEGSMTSVGATYYVYYSANVYTVTFNADGGSCAVGSKKVKYDEIYGYNADTGHYDGLPTPIKLGYEFDGWKLNYNKIEETDIVNIVQDVELVATWKAKKYSLTIHYVKPDEDMNGDGAPDTAFASVTYSLDYGSEHSYASPGLTGYTADPDSINLIVPAQNTVITVRYTKNSYTLTINYLNGSDPIYQSYIESVKYGDSYSKESPKDINVGGYIYNCSENDKIISGIMGAQDIVINVYYYQGEFVPEIHYTIEWGDMNFSYNKGVWDSETHTYNDGYFVPVDDSNYITVSNTNKSNVSIMADFSHEIGAAYPTIGGYYTSTANKADTHITTSSEIKKKSSVTVWFWLDGQMAQGAQPGSEHIVGTCTVTIRSGAAAGQ